MAKYVLKDGKLQPADQVQPEIKPAQVVQEAQKMQQPVQSDEGFEQMEQPTPIVSKPQPVQPQYVEQPVQQPAYQEPQLFKLFIILEGGIRLSFDVTEDEFVKLDEQLITAMQEHICLRLENKIINGDKILMYEVVVIG